MEKISGDNLRNKEDILKNLSERGIKNPERVKSLIHESINFYNLNLGGMTILTEVGSKYYAITPLIAALSGGEVFAYTRDSSFGKKEEISEFYQNLELFCNVKNQVSVIFNLTEEIIFKSNIITNLGFLRPIDKKFIEMMNDKSVISYMYETWERRYGDVDLAYCKEKNIPVLGTNEFFPGKEVFNYVGNLCIKLLFELDVEIYSSKIIIVSSDKFGRIIWKFLSSVGAEAYIVDNLKTTENRQYLIDCDAVVIADYFFTEKIIGKSDVQISVEDLIKYSQKTAIVKIVGNIDVEEIRKWKIPVAPSFQSGTSMGVTMAYLGPKPIIDLHTAGLKVGEVMAKARLSGKSIDDTIQMALTISPAQTFNE